MNALWVIEGHNGNIWISAANILQKYLIVCPGSILPFRNLHFSLLTLHFFGQIEVWSVLPCDERRVKWKWRVGFAKWVVRSGKW